MKVRYTYADDATGETIVIEEDSANWGEIEPEQLIEEVKKARDAYFKNRKQD